MTRVALSIFFVLAFMAVTVSANPAHKTSSDGLWKEISDASLRQTQAQRPIIPQAYRTYSLNLDAMRQLLNQAPMELTEAARRGNVIMTLPMPDGTFARFSVAESPVMEAGLAAKFPEIKTYSAQGIDDPTATMRFDVTPFGFHAMVLSTKDTVYIDPYAKGNTSNYISYFKHDLVRDGRTWECGFKNPAGADVIDEAASPESVQVVSGATRRTYRLALAATGEYTAFFGGTVSGAMAGMTTSMNRVNAVYERDVAIHMNLVANNNLIVYTNAITDPYTNDDGFAMLDENQANVDTVIQNANYDIGHVFSTGGGGVADLGVPCTTGAKAAGVTGSPAPTGDGYDIDYVAHEMGHQFGALHTFNGVTLNCGGGNRSGSAAYEPGSGITIMAYAGICGAQDLAAHSIDTFHVKSLEQIINFREGGGFCGPSAATGNTPPSVTGAGSFTIPKSTPFALTATGSDVDGDSLTYDWQEYDLGSQSPPDNDADGQARPILRPYSPTTGSTRTFPSIQFILNNANVPPATTGGFVTGEILPSISRTMTFQVVARDNRANAGGIRTATSTVVVNGASGPFAITAPNTAVSWAGNTTQTVTWNVNGTSGAPVNAANVKISLSTNGGTSFPTVLVASTANDGSETITVPNTPTGTARIKVEAVGNIFFDISNVNFTITPGVTPPPRAVLDFDGDNKTDYAVTRNNGGSLTWYLQKSTAGFSAASFGLTASDQLVPGDYDGDGKWDIAVWRAGSPSLFFILRSSDNTVQGVSFGLTGDDPRVTADFDNDGKADPAVVRNNGGALTWYMQRSTAGFTGVTFGSAATDVPIRGDFDGDGKADVAVYRNSTGTPANTFFVLRSSDGAVQASTFGLSTLDYVVPGDFDGDNKTDYAVWRGKAGGNGTWYWLNSSDSSFHASQFGTANLDQPVPGDYDSDGKTDLAVWRPGTPSIFFVNGTTAGVSGYSFGLTNDVPPGFSLQAR